MAINETAFGGAVTQPRFPIHRGPFLFGPEFLVGAAWDRSFQALIEEVLGALNLEAEVVVRKPQQRNLIIRFSSWELTVNGQNGTFGIASVGYADLVENNDDSGWCSSANSPRRFLCEISMAWDAAEVDHEHADVFKFSSALFQRMRARIETAVVTGQALVRASLGSWLAPLRVLDMEQVKRIPLDRNSDSHDEDVTLGRGLIDGEILERIGVEPGAAAARLVKTKGAPLTIDQHEVEAALLQQFEQRGVPRKGTVWNNEAVVRAVLPKVNAKRTAILKIIPPAIHAFKKRTNRARPL